MNTAHDLGDTARLDSWLGDHVPGFQGPVAVKKFASGQSNPTYLLTAPSGRYVLRRKPSGSLLPSAHAVDREFRVMRALAGSDVPVPDVYALCRDESVIGTMFFVMAFLDGLTLFDPRLPELDNACRARLYARQVEVLAALARLDVDAVGLGDYGPRGHYFARQIDRWTRQYRASETETIEEMERLIAWLGDNAPAQTNRTALVHGDFRLDNLRVAVGGRDVLGVIDWELSTLGDPYVDIAYLSTMLRLPASDRIGGLAGVNRESLGIPGEFDMLGRFCELAQLPRPDNWNFYLVFHCFRFVAILQGITKRYQDGNASSETARETGAMARPIAKMGCAILTH